MTLVHPGPSIHGHPDELRSWRSGPCRALEHRFTVEAESAEGCREEFKPVTTALRDSLGTVAGDVCQYVVRRAAEEGAAHTLFAAGERLASGRRVSDLTTTLTWHINQSAVERSAERYVLLHASAATITGMTVILPGDEESGKSTTVAGLLRNGFDYVTDEIVAMEPMTGAVIPYPKALSIDPGAWSLFPEARPLHSPDDWRKQWQVSPRLLGARAVQGPCPAPRVIVFPKYVNGTATSILPLSKGDAVRELARMSFKFPRYARRNLQLFSHLVRGATVAQLRIGDLQSAVSAIEQLVSQKLLEAL